MLFCPVLVSVCHSDNQFRLIHQLCSTFLSDFAPQSVRDNRNVERRLISNGEKKRVPKRYEKHTKNTWIQYYCNINIRYCFCHCYHYNIISHCVCCWCIISFIRKERKGRPTTSSIPSKTLFFWFRQIRQNVCSL